MTDTIPAVQDRGIEAPATIERSKSADGLWVHVAAGTDPSNSVTLDLRPSAAGTSAYPRIYVNGEFWIDSQAGRRALWHGIHMQYAPQPSIFQRLRHAADPSSWCVKVSDLGPRAGLTIRGQGKRAFVRLDWAALRELALLLDAECEHA